jgi:hypothetical protein
MGNVIGASGRPAEVNEDNQLQTEAMTVSLGWKRAVDDAEVWSLPITSTTPTGANDHFFHLKNNYETRSVAVVSIALVRASGSESVTILVATGTASSPTAITPVSWAIGATNVPNVTAQRGVDLILTAGATIETIALTTTRTVFPSVSYNTPLILRPGGAFVLNAVTGTSGISGNIIIVAI